MASEKPNTPEIRGYDGGEDRYDSTMPLRTLLRLGHPALRSAARAVPPSELGGERLQGLVQDLFQTLTAVGGAGLAAPQVGALEQVFVLSEAVSERPAPGLAVVNPLLMYEGHEWVLDWEGCFSIPDLRGLVPRHTRVRLQGWTPEGTPLDLRFEGFAARVIQHEYDHLNGIVFLDRMRDLHSLAFRDEWLQYGLGRAPSSLDPSSV
jgi:peptide deformylase